MLLVPLLFAVMLVVRWCMPCVSAGAIHVALLGLMPPVSPVVLVATIHVHRRYCLTVVVMIHASLPLHNRPSSEDHDRPAADHGNRRRRGPPLWSPSPACLSAGGA